MNPSPVSFLRSHFSYLVIAYTVNSSRGQESLLLHKTFRCPVFTVLSSLGVHTLYPRNSSSADVHLYGDPVGRYPSLTHADHRPSLICSQVSAMPHHK